MMQQLFNMMFTLFMGKLMLNDVPHYLFEDVTMRTLRVKRISESGEEYATPAQLRYIAILSAKLKIPEPVVKYKGEAGLMIRHLEDELKGRKKLKSSNPAPTGTCYPDAWRYLFLYEEGFLIHGSLKLSEEGKRVKHAWVELPYGWIWEPQMGQLFTVDDFGRMFDPIIDMSYTIEQAAIMVARTGKHGPWSEEERARWLKGGNPGPYEELPKYAPGPSYQDRQLTPQELRELKLDVHIERLTIDAVEKLYNHFVYEKKNRPWNYNDEQIRTGLTNIYFWLVVEAGESGIGTLNVMHKVILDEIDGEAVYKDIYRDFLTHFHYMRDRWLESLLTGREVDLT